MGTSNNASQLNLDGLPLATLQVMQTNLQNAFNFRTGNGGANPEAAQQYEIKGRKVVRESLADLTALMGAVANAIAKKSTAPGLMKGLAVFSDPNGPGPSTNPGLGGRGY